MKAIYKKARAKVNLTLNVVGKREDGYHNLESVFQKISLYDEIYVSKTDEHDYIRIDVNKPELKDEDNIIFKAYMVLRERFKQIGGINVILKKRIPMQAGFGGGSTDCACFIECMNELFCLNLSKNEMLEIGVGLGADVPPAMYDMPIVASGIGEIAQEICSRAKYYVVAIKPDFSCNTKEMFGKLDARKEIVQKYNTEEMKKALEEGNIAKIASNLYNVFEFEVEGIEELKQEILNAGAMGSLMTGSGSAVYGIFEDKTAAKEAYRVLSKKYETYYCVSCEK